MTTGTSAAEVVILPDDAAQRIRTACGVSRGGQLRVSYISGPGDVAGTYSYWQSGEHDPRVPVVTYSAMVFELARKLGAALEVLTQSTLTPTTIRAGDVSIIPVMRPPAEGRIAHRISALRFGRALKKHLDQFEPHLVLVSSDIPPAAWPSLAGEGRRLILSLHNTFWPMGRRPRSLAARLKLMLVRRRLRVFESAICTSEECARQIAELSGGLLTTAVQRPQFIRTFHPEDRSRVRRLLYVGRIEDDKGVFHLLDAFLSARSRHPDVELTYAGTGSSFDRLRERCRADAPDVRILGQLPADRVHEEIARSDVLVCPTTTRFNEGLAMVALEAAVHGGRHFSVPSYQRQSCCRGRVPRFRPTT